MKRYSTHNNLYFLLIAIGIIAINFFFIVRQSGLSYGLYSWQNFIAGYFVQLTVTSNGNGTVTSEPAGIDCPNSCIAVFDFNSAVTLKPIPDPGLTFTGWSGDCTGIGSCVVTMTQARSVTATFLDVLPVSGGQYNGDDVGLFTFPAGSFTETVMIEFQSISPFPSPPDIDLFFDITAVRADNNQQAADLAPGRTYTAEVTYDEDSIPAGLCESQLTLFGWIPKSLQRTPEGPLGTWVPQPSSMVNVNNNTVTAELGRLGTHAIFGSYCIYMPALRR